MKRGWSLAAAARWKASPSVSASGSGLDVEVVEHLHVIADEADGGDDHVAHSVARERSQGVADVGLEATARAASRSGSDRRATTAGATQSPGDPGLRPIRAAPRRASQRPSTRGTLCAVKTRWACVAPRGRHLGQRRRRALRHRIDEERVLGPGRREGDLGSGGADLLPARPRRRRRSAPTTPRSERTTG